MHGRLAHRHASRETELRERNTLDDSDSLANVVERAAANKDGYATVYSVVYVTASATFSGPTAGYVTMGLSSSSAAAAKASNKNSNSDSTTHDSASATKTGTTAKSTLVKSATPSATTHSASTSSAQSDSSTAETSSATSTSASAVSSSATSSSSASVSGTALAEATSSSSATASAAASPGLSSGAKGGIAFAVILGLGLLAGLAFFFYRRKKSQQGNMGEAQRLEDDEKRPPPPPVKEYPPPPVIPRSQPPRKETPAPRLSIRPTSRFSLGADPEKTAAAITAVGENEGGNPAADPANPFGNHAETVNATANDEVASPTSKSSVSFELEGSAVPSAGAGVSDASPTAPSGTEFGTAAAVPVGVAGAAAAAASGAVPASSNVHRVQLEFKPSMDDELELKVGSLVRVLHEYDDGWALCMTMDRSKQGVAPRTCVSKLPLKPRPTQNNRPTGPPQPGQNMRNASEPIRPSSLVPAPLSPSVNGRVPPVPSQQQRQRTASGPTSRSAPQTPGMNAPQPQLDTRTRSASVGSSTLPKGNSPTGPSPLNPVSVPARKPVPGQAL